MVLFPVRQDVERLLDVDGLDIKAPGQDAWVPEGGPDVPAKGAADLGIDEPQKE
jgi:hypothetical protein